MSSPNSKLPNLSSKTEEFVSKLEENTTTPLYKMSPAAAREFLEEFPVDKAYFNYDTESFISKEFTLPYIYNEDNKKLEVTICVLKGTEDKKRKEWIEYG